MAPLKICLHGQLFVHVETSRSHLAWSTDDRNLMDFLVIKTNLSNFCCKCDLQNKTKKKHGDSRNEIMGSVVGGGGWRVCIQTTDIFWNYTVTDPVSSLTGAPLFCEMDS